MTEHITMIITREIVVTDIFMKVQHRVSSVDHRLSRGGAHHQ